MAALDGHWQSSGPRGVVRGSLSCWQRHGLVHSKVSLARRRGSRIAVHLPRPPDYSTVGKFDRDQVMDYHARKGLTFEEVERWLGPWLNYNPAEQSFPGNARVACACGAAH